MSDRFVIDTTILVQAYVIEPHTRRVQTLLQGLGKVQPDEIYVPEFCLIECANVLWQHVRRHGMPITTAEQHVKAINTLPLKIYPATGLMERAFEIAIKHQQAIYDSIFIALAELIGCPLITMDARQANVAVAAGVTLKPITDFPEFVK